MPAGSLHTDRSRKSSHRGQTATKAIELRWAFTEAADGQLRHDTARRIDGVLTLTVDLRHRPGHPPDSVTAVDWRGPIEAHVTAAMSHGPTSEPNRSPILSTVATLTIQPRGQWTHLKITIPHGASAQVAATRRVEPADAAGETLLAVAFRDGLPIHVRSPLPSMASLPGGTYERPALTLGASLARFDLAPGLDNALGTAV